MEQQLNGHQADADGDGGIRNIESRPVIWKKVKIEKIDHLSISNSIDEISNRSAQDEGKGQGEGPLMLLCLMEEVKDHSDRGHRNRDEEERANPFFFSCKDPEGPSGVSQVGEIKESIDHFDGLIEGDFLLGFVLGVLIRMRIETKQMIRTKYFRFISFGPMVYAVIKSLKIELTCSTKSPLAPLCQRGAFSLPLEKGGEEGFYKTMSFLLWDC